MPTVPALDVPTARLAAARAAAPASARRRIVVVTQPAGWGGTEVNTVGVVRELAARGHAVTVLQLGDDVYDRYLSTPQPFATVTVPMPEPLEHLSVRWWCRLLRGCRPDVVVLSKGAFDIQAPALDLAVRLLARRYVLLEHHPATPPPARSSRRHLGGLLPGLALWWWRKQLPRRLHLRAAHRIITDSAFVTDILAEHYALPRARAVCVPWGIDVTRFTFRADARQRLRDGWGLPPEALVVGSVGRLAVVKGPDRALRAFAALREARPALPAWLVLAGEGPEAEAMRTLAEELGIADRVVLPGFVEDAAEALSALDVYLMPSRSEGLGMALIEAMACERSCVAMNSGGPGEILTDPSLGWLTPADDVAAFTVALLTAVEEDEAARAARGRRARAHVVARFDERRQTGRVAGLIESA